MSQNYDPELPRLVLFPGDKIAPAVVIPTVGTFTAVAGTLYDPGDADVTTAYVAGSPAASGNTLTGGTLGIGSGTIVEGDYKYYLTGTYDGGKITTWYWPVSCVAKKGGT